MKTLGLIIITALMSVSCNQKSPSEEKLILSAPPEAAQDGVFIHITESYDDPHRVLMPLKMATMMADDKDVMVYMDIHAVKLLVNGAEDLNFAGFQSAHTYIKQLAAMNVGVYACPTCLKVAGLNSEDLMDGVQEAEKDKFFSFTEGRIITLDY